MLISLVMPSFVSASLAGDNILITEVMPDAVESGVDNEFEWVELYNPTNMTIDIDGWEVEDGAGNDYVFNSATDNTVMLSGEYRLLVLDATDTPANGKTDTNGKSFEIAYPGILAGLPVHSAYIDLVEAVRLNNTGDFVQICSGVCDGMNQVDYVEWEDFSGSGLWNDDAGSGTGNAICREGIVDTDTESDWSVTACNTDPTNLANDGNPGTGTYGVFGVSITETDGSTDVMEGTGDDAVGVVLEAAPEVGETVTVSFVTDGQCDVVPASIVFTNADWDASQDVTVTASDDAVDKIDPHDCVITTTTTSSDTGSGFHVSATDNVTTNISDPSAVVVPPSSATSIPTTVRSSKRDRIRSRVSTRATIVSVPMQTEMIDEAEKGIEMQCLVFTEFNSLTENVVSEEVGRAKVLLFAQGFDVGDINNVYDRDMEVAMIAFQESNREVILDPWGLPAGTGYKYQSTNKYLNYLVGCNKDVRLDNGTLLDY